MRAKNVAKKIEFYSKIEIIIFDNTILVVGLSLVTMPTVQIKLDRCITYIYKAVNRRKACHNF